MIIQIINSDFGSDHTIGKRLEPIQNQLIEPSIVYCRNSRIHKKNIVKVIPFGSILMKILTGIPIYINKKIDTNPLKEKIFSYFLIQKLKKVNLDKVRIVHSWDYLPEVYEYIKKKNENIKVIQDVAMSLGSVIKENKKLNKYWEKEELSAPNNFEKSKRYTDLYIVPSEVTKKSLLLEKIPESKIRVIPFGVDTGRFNQNVTKNKRFSVAFAGNVNNRKGIEFLISAWKLAFENNMELNIYGRVYPESKKYLKELEKYNINLHGFVNLKEELPKNHVFLFPTLMEGSAKAIYEAMACGLVVITTPYAGSIVENEVEGYILEPNEIKEIATLIDVLKKEKNLIIRLRSNSLKKIRKYSWKHYGKNIVREYINI